MRNDVKAARKAAMHNYRRRNPRVRTVLNNTVRIADELIKRLEKTMFAGFNFRDNPGEAPTSNPEIVKELAALGRIVIQLVKLDTQLKKAGKGEEDLTPEEEFDLAVHYVKNLNPDDREKFLAAL